MAVIGQCQDGIRQSNQACIRDSEISKHMREVALGCPLRHTPGIADPAVNASAARVDPEDVLEPEILPEAPVDNLKSQEGESGSDIPSGTGCNTKCGAFLSAFLSALNVEHTFKYLPAIAVVPQQPRP